jgi:hypothetical protein
VRYRVTPVFLRDVGMKEHGLSCSSDRVHRVFGYAVAVVLVDSCYHVTYVVGFKEC